MESQDIKIDLFNGPKEHAIGSMIFGVIMLLVGIISLITRKKGKKLTNFLYFIAGALLFGYLSYAFGYLIFKSNLSLWNLTASFILKCCIVSFGFVGGILTCCLRPFGKVCLGAAVGWTLWWIFSTLVNNIIINLCVGIGFAILVCIITVFYKHKGQIYALIWLECYLTVTGIVEIINGVIYFGVINELSNLNFIIINVSAIVLIFLLFGGFCFHQFKYNQHPCSDYEMQK